MKRSFKCLAVLIGAGALVFSAAQTQAADIGPYLNLDVGANWAQDVDVEIGGLISGTSELDPGFRLGIAGGYNFSEFFGAELETGWLYNEFEADNDTWLAHVPILANAIFRYQNPSRIVPYVGVGAGGVAAMLGIDEDDVDDSDGDFVFAWQGIAGLRYDITDTMSIGIQYKYLGIDGPEFEIEDVGVELDTVHNHTVSVAFNFRF